MPPNTEPRALILGKFSHEEKRIYLTWLFDRALEELVVGNDRSLSSLIAEEVGPDGMQPNQATVWGWIYNPKNTDIVQGWRTRVDAVMAERITAEWPTLVQHLIDKIRIARSPQQIVDGMRFLRELTTVTGPGDGEGKPLNSLQAIMIKFSGQVLAVQDRIQVLDAPVKAAGDIIDGVVRHVD